MMGVPSVTVGKDDWRRWGSLQPLAHSSLPHVYCSELTGNRNASSFCPVTYEVPTATLSDYGSELPQHLTALQHLCTRLQIPQEPLQLGLYPSLTPVE